MLETGVALPASGVSTEYPYFVVIRISLNTAGTKGRTKDNLSDYSYIAYTYFVLRTSIVHTPYMYFDEHSVLYPPSSMPP